MTIKRLKKATILAALKFCVQKGVLWNIELQKNGKLRVNVQSAGQPAVKSELGRVGFSWSATRVESYRVYDRTELPAALRSLA